MGSRILLVEDEPGLRMTLTDRLFDEGYSVETASDGDEGFQRATKEPFDLVILDAMLPRKSGFDVCRDIRTKGVATPILMLSARAEVTDRVVGLKLGADDYVTKPFEMPELLARVEARVRKSPSDPRRIERYTFGSVVVDFRKAEVIKDGRAVTVSAKEFQLLKYFILHRGETLTRDELLNGVWGYDAMPATRTVDVHVSWLRGKVEPDPRNPRFIQTLHRLGYKFVD